MGNKTVAHRSRPWPHSIRALSTAVALVTIASFAASAAAATVAHSDDLIPRHGDGEQEHADMPTMMHDIPLTPDNHQVDTTLHTHSHAHSHPNPYDGIPDASVAGPTMFVVPSQPHGAGGHSHGTTAALIELNETTILRSKGPDPLSFIEWDFGYGIGTPAELRRFVEAAQADPQHDLMAVAGGRYRRLLDERETNLRSAIVQDLYDRVHAGEGPNRYRFFLVLHVVGCVLSCFVLLPATLALRAASSGLAPLTSLAYLVSLASSLLASMLYKAMTPRLYPAHAHSGLGCTIFWLSVVALGGDVVKLIGNVACNVRSARSWPSHSIGFGALLRVAKTATRLSRSSHDAAPGANTDTWQQRFLDLEHMAGPKRRQSSTDSSGASSRTRSVHFEDTSPDVDLVRLERRSTTSSARTWSRDLPSPTSTLLGTPRTSVTDDHSSVLLWKLNRSDEHWCGEEEKVEEEEKGAEEQMGRSNTRRRPVSRQWLGSILRYTHIALARSLPLLSFAAAYTGLAVYTGACRGPYKNTCLAHGIKGGIFFWYGLLSFGRYLGAYADLGWAWNRRPGAALKKGKDKRDGNGAGVTAEWLECCVIFVYGATNTWMERFGAAPGDPYTVKQVQHISIAVMFWFAGLMGLILETKSLRSLLAFPVTLKEAQRDLNAATIEGDEAEALVSARPAPPSYTFAFNPFPALVIGVTGVAMAAHHQDYVYEVLVHALWGNLLAGFSLLRILTYVFLWLRPPTSSVMPSRPPTEALASFSLTCGGLVFMLSSEEVSFAAMRNGFGDFMMLLNVTVAVVSLLFCGVTGMMVLKAWAEKREHTVTQNATLQRQRRARLHEQESTSNSTFVVGDEDDDADEDEERVHACQQDEKRQLLSSSPEQV